MKLLPWVLVVGIIVLAVSNVVCLVRYADMHDTAARALGLISQWEKAAARMEKLNYELVDALQECKAGRE
jgi:hypothetical protein